MYNLHKVDKFLMKFFYGETNFNSIKMYKF